MRLRFANLLFVGTSVLLAVVGIVWHPAPHQTVAVPTCELEYVPPRGYVAAKTSTAITVDGQLNDPGWADAPWSDDFVDIEGLAKAKPAHRTRMKICWDDTALYIAAEITEPHVWATLTRHDSVIFHDPDFEVFLDPDGDSHLYGELELNALNTTWDLLLTKPYRAGGKAIDDWEIRGLKTAVRVDGTINDAHDQDRGWTVEIAWPWAGLRQLTSRTMPPKSGDQWRINFSRVEWDVDIVNGKYRKIENRPEHNWVWSPQGAIDMHRPELWGYLQFSDGTSARELRPDPTGPARMVLYGVGEAQRAFRQQHGRFARSMHELGLAGLTHSSLTGPVRIDAVGNWYEAAADLVSGERVSSRADSRVTVNVGEK